MASRLNPYLSFKDDTRQAMDFYQSVFGGELDSSTFAEGGMPTDAEHADLIMHAMLTTPSGFVLMASDAPPGMPLAANGTVSLSGDDEAELRGYWDKLMDGGTVVQPLEPAPWGDLFGMGADRFGVNWLVDIGPAS